jgi:DhnA family fructose-bisphosphate aldolase class Ia
MFDHGLFGEPSWLGNHTLIAELVRRGSEARFDALSLPARSAAMLQAIPGPERPALILRGDVCDYWLRRSPTSVSMPLAGAVEDALRLDAACMITTIISSTSQPGLQTACLRTVDAVRAACARYAIPVVIEAVAFRDDDGMAAIDDLETVATLARQAAELGADVVKVEPSAEASDFAEVVAAAGPAPVLAGSGATVDDEAVLERTRTLVAAGAAGVGYGGNYLRATDPVAFAARVAAAVHGEGGSR